MARKAQGRLQEFPENPLGRPGHPSHAPGALPGPGEEGPLEGAQGEAEPASFPPHLHAGKSPPRSSPESQEPPRSPVPHHPAPRSVPPPSRHLPCHLRGQLGLGTDARGHCRPHTQPMLWGRTPGPRSSRGLVNCAEKPHLGLRKHVCEGHRSSFPRGGSQGSTTEAAPGFPRLEREHRRPWGEGSLPRL